MPNSKNFQATQPTVRVDYWQSRMLEIETQLQTRPDLDAVKLLFVGDSITDLWQVEDDPWHWGQKYGRSVWETHFSAQQPQNYGFNLGVFGDKTEHLLHRLLPQAEGGSGHLDNQQLAPQFIMLMIGINNTHMPEQPVADSVYAGICAVLKRLQMARPTATILLQSLLPTPDSERNAVVQNVNARLEVLPQNPACSGNAHNLQYLNLYDAFIDANGRQISDYFSDGLHPNLAGYRVWCDRLLAALRTLRGGP